MEWIRNIILVPVVMAVVLLSSANNEGGIWQYEKR